MMGVKRAQRRGGRDRGLHASKERGDIKKEDEKRKGDWYTFPHNARKIEMLSANNIIEDILNGESLIRIQEIILDPK